LVGASTENIFAAASELFENERCYKAMAHVRNPFGDGHAADYIVEILKAH
jgi:UDP-N-acetylglucosamine 2-epimerase (non-hydrolysing)